LELRLDEDAIVFDLSEQHIPCVAHVFNLAIQTFLQNLKVLEEPTDSASDIGDQLAATCVDPEKDFAVTIKKNPQYHKGTIPVT
jgi:hypothetical protein